MSSDEFAEWKNQYYHQKFAFEADAHGLAERRKLVETYLEGIVWVLNYYYNGVPSWSWFGGDGGGVACGWKTGASEFRGWN